MGFWGVRVGSHGVKKMNEVLRFKRKVGQCNTFEGRKKYFEFGVVEKKLCCPDGFYLFLGRAGCENYTSPKIWRPCPKMGQGWPWKGRGRVESQAPLPPHLPPPPLPPPFPLGLGRGKGGGRGGGISGGKGGPGLEEGVHGLGPCTTPSLGCPPKGMLKLDHFSISFGDFSFFL
jgi:hypothetical protein